MCYKVLLPLSGVECTCNYPKVSLFVINIPRVDSGSVTRTTTTKSKKRGISEMTSLASNYDCITTHCPHLKLLYEKGGAWAMEKYNYYHASWIETLLSHLAS
jgi:hypothetical protein